MHRDGRALKDKDVNRIEADVFKGFYNDKDLASIFETIRVQRKVLRALFDQFHREPFRRVSTADPIHNSNLAYLKELASMEDEPFPWQV